MPCGYTREELEARAREATRARIAANLAGAGREATTRDALYSPSEWWADEARTQRQRAIASVTSAELTGDTIRVHVNIIVEDL